MGAVFAGRYELVDPLGSGGAGVVWRVWDRRERRYLAAKVLRQVDADSLLRFMREQSVRIAHPHILTPIGWAGADDQVLFTMPIVAGGSVSTLVGDHGALPTAWVASLLDQVLVALERIHAQGLVHRDVKPANLLLEATGRSRPHLLLSDFGIAAAVGQPRLTHTDVALGTPGFLAPECLVQGWDPNPAVDLYGAGMAAAQMLTGERPAAGMPAAEMLAGTAVVPALAAIVVALADPDPARRPASAATARQLLHASGLVAQPWDSTDVEVFHHVPDLPSGWGPGGPVADRTPPEAVTGPTTLVPVAAAGIAESRPAGLLISIALLLAGVALVGLAIALVLV